MSKQSPMSPRMVPRKPVGEFTGLAAGSLVTVGAFRHGSEPHRDPDDEVFVGPSLIFTTAGTWDLRTRSGWYHAYPGTFVFGHAGEHYRCRHDKEVPEDRAVYTSFRQPLLEDVVRHTDRLPASVRSLAPVTAPMRDLLHLLVREARGPADSLKVDLLAVALLVDAAQLCGTLVPPLAVARRSARVEAARDYLHAHFPEAIDLATLAGVAGFSPFHFARLFRMQVGDSPHRYLVSLRLDKAAELLQATELSVTEICHEVGFGSLSHFINAFRRHTGKTPTQFRRR